jgi:chlorophyllide a reductase subunit Y
MGPAGPGSLSAVVNAALASKPRFDAMRDFFEGVGEGASSGIWPEAPKPRRAAAPRVAVKAVAGKLDRAKTAGGAA